MNKGRGNIFIARLYEAFSLLQGFCIDLLGAPDASQFIDTCSVNKYSSTSIELKDTVMDVRQTPDHCFENLIDFPYAPNFAEISDTEGGRLKMHYVDEGPRDGPVAVFIHGNPTWSFMWRHQIAAAAKAGYRAIAIDLIGMGRSDKPTQMQDYSIARHQAWVEEALFDVLKLDHVNFVLHDWGGIIGLRAIAAHQDKTASVVLSNTGLPVVDPNNKPKKIARAGAGFLRAFQLYVRYRKNWQHWKMLKRILTSNPPAEVIAGYAAPYPDKTYLTGNRQFTQMLPTRNDNPMLVDNWHALQKLLSFEKPFLNLFSDKDIVAPKGFRSVRPAIPGTRAYEPIILKGGSHFLVEDIAPAYSEALLAFWQKIKKEDENAA
jgi:haloalkane dehalogenase